MWVTTINEMRDIVGIILMPFQLVIAFIGLILNITGRLIGAVLGLVLMIIGFALTITFIGAFIGIPLMILGLLIMIRSLLR